MQTIEYRTVDKSAWGNGPWQDEPDKVQWQDEATGLPCLIVRGPIGAWCGYVGVAESHPWFGIAYSGRLDRVETEESDWDAPTPESEIDVHWGLTFSDHCQEGADESSGICHKPAQGEPDHVWWFGFDCAHCDDFAPGMHGSWRGGEYRTIDYVKRQVGRLAEQLSQPAARGGES